MQWILAMFCGGALALTVLLGCQWLFCQFLRPKSDGVRLVIVPVKGFYPYFEQQLRWQLFCLNSYPIKESAHLIIVNLGAHSDTLAVATLFAREHSQVMLCNQEELKAVFADVAVCKTIETVIY